MNISARLIGLVVFLGCVAGGAISAPPEYLLASVIFGLFAGADAALAYAVARSIRAVLGGGPIRWI